MTNRLCYIILLFQLLGTSLNVAAQNCVGISSGGTVNRFFDYLSNENYPNGYLFKTGFNGALIYEIKVDSVTQFKTELQYNYNELKLKVRYFTSSSSFFNNSLYETSQIRLNLSYLFRLNDINKKNKFFLIFGMSLGYSLQTNVIGTGYDSGYIVIEDTSGNPITIWRTINWEKSELNNKDFTNLNFGLITGLEHSFPINNSFEFFIQHKYIIVLTNTLRINVAYTSIFSAYLNLGIKYNFIKRRKF